MANEKKIYLGRRGKSYGPYSSTQLDQMRLSGELETFTFRWDDDSLAWKPLENAPPPPGASPVSSAVASGGIEAICHDFTTIVSGLLQNVSELGCDLVSHDGSDGPRLGLKAKLVLNVVDKTGKQAMNVNASLSDVVRRDSAWVYRIRWSHAPFPTE